MLVMTGANSAVGLRSMPVRYLFLDEVDGYPLDVEGEGDAISLAEARTHLCPAQDLHRVDADDLGLGHRAGSTRPATSAATSCRARTATTGNGCASSNCAGTRGQPETAATSARSCDTADCRAPQDLDAGNGEWRAMAEKARRLAFTCRRCTARWAGAPGVTSLPRGKPPSTRSRDRRPRSRPSRTPSWARPGSRKAKRRLATAGRAPRGLSDGHRATGRPAVGGRGRRAEGSHRGLDLGLWARQGVLAHRAPSPDGRYRTGCGVESVAEMLAENPGRTPPGWRCRWRASRSTPLCHAGSLRLRARLPRSARDGGQGRAAAARH